MVNEMLDQLPEHVWRPGKSFLDPACGCIDQDGFLPWVLRRKLAHGCTVMEALKDIHGVELQADNLDDCRRRLLAIVAEHEQVEIGHIMVVLTNVRQGDALEDPINTEAWWVPISREEAVEWCGAWTQPVGGEPAAPTNKVSEPAMNDTPELGMADTPGPGMADTPVEYRTGAAEPTGPSDVSTGPSPQAANDTPESGTNNTPEPVANNAPLAPMATTV
jgi:hypothetical protein